MKSALALLLAAAIPLQASLRAHAADKWQVHEWGTFTSLQDESGNAVGGINTDDEPVPEFVHHPVGNRLVIATEAPPMLNKGTPNCHPDVTMRMETPVIYFHPPKSLAGVQTASVRVKFRGGWLTEFYPLAGADEPGYFTGAFRPGHLTDDTVGSLEWNDIQIGGDWPLTNTAAHVWTSPRAVQSALVQATNGESEKFLFYRGVAHLDAPLKIVRDRNTGELLFQSQLEDLEVKEPLALRFLWLVDIQPAGRIAFRPLPPIALGNNSRKLLFRTPAEFAPDDYRPENLDQLKASLLAALTAEGLFRDEAQALLNTWELSYFKNPGLRLFFLVPRAWTDSHLPLEFSHPADLCRVMVGRIELVSPRQRDILRELSSFSTNRITREATQLLNNFEGPLMRASQSDERQMQKLNAEMMRIYEGQSKLSDFVSVPRTYQLYLDLGRFRNALVLDEVRTRPSQGLAAFIATYGLHAYRPADPARAHHVPLASGLITSKN